MSFSLDKQGIQVAEIHRNATPAFLYEAALKFEKKNANRKGAIAALESALAAKQEKN